ncbi:MAG: alpha/beta hydrolase [Desulfobacterales bacterium]|nr:alpha/beta hydrolase [Desulfobacterales bacterium]MCP4158666.1 alpha/beta hydrolase [Deltaproteobacteria bacterium]
MDRTFILPGMGADSSMYQSKEYDNIKGVIFTDWPSYNGEKTIEDVAERIIHQHKITNHDIVGGSSLGGIIAIEIARKLEIKKILLIGSATTPDKINSILKNLSIFVNITPLDLFKELSLKFNNDNRILEMFGNADSDFVREMCNAVFLWKGLEGYKGEVCKIHGETDRVIYPDSDAHIISNGGHLIAMTHSKLVADFIKKSRNGS